MHLDLHGLLLLSQAHALPDLLPMRRYLRTLLPQADALPDLLPMRRYLRALLPQADALFLPAAGPARVLRTDALPEVA